MSFPRKINNKISGKLNLTIRSPKTQVSFGDEVDYDFELSGPTGFSIKRGLKEQVEQNVSNARKRVSEIVKKSKECSSCTLSQTSVISSHMCLDIISQVSKFSDDKFHLMLGQDENSNITIDVLYSNRQCSIIVVERNLSCGFYENDILLREDLSLHVDDGLSIIMFLVGMEN